jgi:enamine deaminase RidA (YjgF/YER057c/UK114 family)
MMRHSANPFPTVDADRHQIWKMLVEDDIAAFLEGDWSRIENDFAADRFVGHSGTSNPDHWRIAFPSLRAYRDSWLNQARTFGAVQLRSQSKAEFLFDATGMRDIEIGGDHAIAHKKFDGSSTTADGSDLTLSWQTMYWLQRIAGQWKITGFLGYLPNPMPRIASESQATAIYLPESAVQHKTAGPYSPVLKVKFSALVAISGQGPIDSDGNIHGRNIEEQTVFTLENCRRQLDAAGATFADVFKVVVYLRDMADWDAFNVVYRRYLIPPFPVRTAIQAVLWGHIKVEIDMLATGK